MTRSSTDERLATDVASLEGLDLEGLRQAWRARLASPPPPVRSGDLMRRLLAERLQLQALGGDAELDRQLAQLAPRYRKSGGVKATANRVRTRTVIVREHQGRVHRVEVVDDGFAWQGRTWRSLSEIAREITGVRWNGPRFFGLREAKAAS